MENNRHFKVWGSVAIVACIIIAIVYVLFFRNQISTEDYINVVDNANDQFNVGNVDASVIELETLLSKNLENNERLEALVSLASVYAQKGSLEFKEKEYGEKTIALINQALEIDPSNSDAYRVMAYAYEIMEKYPEATAYYQKAITLNVKNAMAYSGLGHAYDLMGEKEKAKVALEEAVRLNPDLDHALYNLARIYFSERNAVMAQKYAEQAIAVSENTRFKSEATNMLGILKMNEMMYDEAIILFEKAIALDTTLANNYVLLADAKMLDFGKNIFSIGISDIEVKQAELLKEVSVLIDKAIEINPSLSSAYLVKARIFSLQDNFIATREALETGLSKVDSDITLSSAAKEKMRSDFNMQIRVYSGVTNQ